MALHLTSASPRHACWQYQHSYAVGAGATVRAGSRAAAPDRRSSRAWASTPTWSITARAVRRRFLRIGGERLLPAAGGDRSLRWVRWCRLRPPRQEGRSRSHQPDSLAAAPAITPRKRSRKEAGALTAPAAGTGMAGTPRADHPRNCRCCDSLLSRIVKTGPRGHRASTEFLRIVQFEVANEDGVY